MIPIRSSLVFIILCSSFLAFEATTPQLVDLPTNAVLSENDKLSAFGELSARSNTDGHPIKPLRRKTRDSFAYTPRPPFFGRKNELDVIVHVISELLSNIFRGKREVSLPPESHTLRFRNLMNRTMEIECQNPDELYGTTSADSEPEIASTDLHIIRCTCIITIRSSRRNATLNVCGGDALNWPNILQLNVYDDGIYYADEMNGTNKQRGKLYTPFGEKVGLEEQHNTPWSFFEDYTRSVYVYRVSIHQF